jgi:hypothetical protein
MFTDLVDYIKALSTKDKPFFFFLFVMLPRVTNLVASQ